MSLEYHSPKRNRVYKRKFDHDEAIRLRRDGATYQAIAERLGVTPGAIRQACNPEVRARMHETARENFRAICDDCGGPCTHNWWSKRQRHDRVVCFKCSKIRQREETLLKRMNDAGDLMCSGCHEHKPMEHFSMTRGFPRRYCGTCETVMRGNYRAAHREEDRAYQRARRARARITETANPPLPHG